jgi:flagellin
MALTITNTPTTSATINVLNRTQDSLTSSLEKISSGLRINRAADDAAGLGVSTKMNSDNTSLRQAMRNTNDGISMIQTAEGSLSELSNILVRMRELSVQASNETYNTSDRGMISTEMTQLRNEYRRITTTANFNGTALLRNADTSFQIQVGIGTSSNDRISIDMSLLASTLGATGMGSISVLSGQISLSGNQTVAQANIGRLDTAITAVATRRARLGAYQNRMENALSEATNYSLNLASASSRITDVDYASESANMTRFQIQQQAGVAALAQAKTMNQSIISLLN